MTMQNVLWWSLLAGLWVQKSTEFESSPYGYTLSCLSRLIWTEEEVKQEKIWLLQLTNDAFVLPTVFVLSSPGWDDCRATALTWWRDLSVTLWWEVTYAVSHLPYFHFLTPCLIELWAVCCSPFPPAHFCCEGGPLINFCVSNDKLESFNRGLPAAWYGPTSDNTLNFS